MPTIGLRITSPPLAVKAFAGRLPGDAYRAFLESQEATEEELASILRRDLRVTRFLASKVPFAARVTEPDVRRYWTTHAELAEQPYERVREAIYAQLTRERYRTLPAARKQLEDQRAKADVRTVTSFAPAPPPPGGAAGTARP